MSTKSGARIRADMTDFLASKNVCTPLAVREGSTGTEAVNFEEAVYEFLPTSQKQ